MNRSVLSPLHRIAVHQSAFRLQRRFESNSVSFVDLFLFNDPLL